MRKGEELEEGFYSLTTLLFPDHAPNLMAIRVHFVEHLISFLGGEDAIIGSTPNNPVRAIKGTRG